LAQDSEVFILNSYFSGVNRMRVRSRHSDRAGLVNDRAARKSTRPYSHTNAEAMTEAQPQCPHCGSKRIYIECRQCGTQIPAPASSEKQEQSFRKHWPIGQEETTLANPVLIAGFQEE
jgi:hypothetical protein